MCVCVRAGVRVCGYVCVCACMYVCLRVCARARGCVCGECVATNQGATKKINVGQLNNCVVGIIAPGTKKVKGAKEQFMEAISGYDLRVRVFHVICAWVNQPHELESYILTVWRASTVQQRWTCLEPTGRDLPELA